MSDSIENRSGGTFWSRGAWIALGLLLAVCLLVAGYEISMSILSAIGGSSPPPPEIKTPNPSRTPIYWLSLQELFVYWNPYLAGVMLPTAILAATIAGPTAIFWLTVQWAWRKWQRRKTSVSTKDLLLAVAISFTLAAAVIVAIISWR